MKTCVPWFAALFLLPLALIGRGEEAKKVTFPRFRMQEIEKGLKVGYAVLLVDVNGDGKKDIVVVDTNRVVWYENPTWKRHTIIEGQTKPDNVCIAAYDIDGDGQLDLWVTDSKFDRLMRRQVLGEPQREGVRCRPAKVCLD